MAQRTLGERFRTGPPTRSPEDRHAWLTGEEKRFILWALRDGWSAARAGRALGVNEATVRRFRGRSRQDVKEIMALDLLENVGPIDEELYRCLVCTERGRGRREVERHLASHFVEQELIDLTLPRKRGRPKGQTNRQRR